MLYFVILCGFFLPQCRAMFYAMSRNVSLCFYKKNFAKLRAVLCETLRFFLTTMSHNILRNVAQCLIVFLQKNFAKLCAVLVIPLWFFFTVMSRNVLRNVAQCFILIIDFVKLCAVLCDTLRFLLPQCFAMFFQILLCETLCRTLRYLCGFLLPQCRTMFYAMSDKAKKSFPFSLLLMLWMIPSTILIH